VVHLSTTQWVIFLGLSIAWAVLGYVLSENDRKTLGRTPWGLPSAVWAFLWFLSLVVGLVLYLIAHSVGIRRAQQGSPLAGSPGAGPPLAKGVAPRGGHTVAERFPSYPQPANAALAPTDSSPVVPEDPVTPAESQPTAIAGTEERRSTQAPDSWPHSPPAWHPDPSGRFHFRWWDGYQWTSQVSTDGHHLIDTNPDQRIGPY
jgi:hypothetical protein